MVNPPGPRLTARCPAANDATNESMDGFVVRFVRDPETGIVIGLLWDQGYFPDGRPVHRVGTLVHLRAILGLTQTRVYYWRESARPSRAALRRDPTARVFSEDLLERKAAFASLRLGPDKYDLWRAWDFKLDVLDYVDTEEIERQRAVTREERLAAWEETLRQEFGEEQNDPRSLALTFFEADTTSPDYERARTRVFKKNSW